MTGKFNHNNSFRKAFEDDCIKILISAYHRVMKDKTINLNWEENDITTLLYQYMDKNKFRLSNNIYVNPEHPLENNILYRNRGFAAKYSRIDIRFVTIKYSAQYDYFAEAKLLKEQNVKLKRRYIKTGIDNFRSGKYYNGCLIGYIVKGDLFKTIEGINKLLKKDNRNTELLSKIANKYHNEYYESVHNSIGLLKHYMFDFTNCGKANAA